MNITNNYTYDSKYTKILEPKNKCVVKDGIGFNSSLNGCANIILYCVQKIDDLNFELNNLKTDQIVDLLETNPQYSGNFKKFNLFKDTNVLNKSSINYNFNLLRQSTWSSGQNVFSIDISIINNSEYYNIYTLNYLDNNTYIGTYIIISNESKDLLNYIGFKNYENINYKNDESLQIIVNKYSVIYKLNQFISINEIKPTFRVIQDKDRYDAINSIYMNSLKCIKINSIYLYNSITEGNRTTDKPIKLVSYYDIYYWLFNYFTSIKLSGDGFYCIGLLTNKFSSIDEINLFKQNLASIGIIGNNDIMFSYLSLYDLSYTDINNDKNIINDIYNKYISIKYSDISYKLSSDPNNTIIAPKDSLFSLYELGKNISGNIGISDYYIEIYNDNLQTIEKLPGKSINLSITDNNIKYNYFTLYLIDKSYTYIITDFILNTEFYISNPYYESYRRFIRKNFYEYTNQSNIDNNIEFNTNFNNINYQII